VLHGGCDGGSHTALGRTVPRGVARAYYDQLVKRRGAAASRVVEQVEQLGIGFEGIEVVEPTSAEPSPDTMRQIVSLRMPDALLARVEEAAQARGVSPSSLMRALIAAGLDRSYAAVREPSDMAAELAELRHTIERLANRMDRSDRSS
jgi:predicted transcriptional regulator